MALVDNVQNVAFASAFPVDKILGTFEGSFTAPPPSGGEFNITTDTTSTNIQETTFFQGIYSIDSGTTWTDFNMSSDDLNLWGRSNSGNFSVVGENGSFSDNTTYSIIYKVVLLSRPNQGNVTAQPVGSDFIFDTRENYQKIKVDSSRSISISDGTELSESFSHSLGYIPKTRSFISTSSSFAGLAAGLYDTNFFASKVFSAGASSPNSGVESTSGIYISDSSATAVLRNTSGAGNFNGTLYMRVYYDS